MVLAWMFFAPVGIFTAKFFRTNKAICGQKLWFQVSSNPIILFKEKLGLALGLGHSRTPSRKTFLILHIIYQIFVLYVH